MCPRRKSAFSQLASLESTSHAGLYCKVAGVFFLLSTRTPSLLRQIPDSCRIHTGQLCLPSHTPRNCTDGASATERANTRSLPLRVLRNQRILPCLSARDRLREFQTGGLFFVTFTSTTSTHTHSAVHGKPVTREELSMDRNYHYAAHGTTPPLRARHRRYSLSAVWRLQHRSSENSRPDLHGTKPRLTYASAFGDDYGLDCCFVGTESGGHTLLSTLKRIFGIHVLFVFQRRLFVYFRAVLLSLCSSLCADGGGKESLRSRKRRLDPLFCRVCMHQPHAMRRVTTTCLAFDKGSGAFL